ncbi:MAG: hypothetical protein K2V38_07455, partial [Gemmataceae bacterium]|nr:hypothetical protein [Gemmataceae bacterium]
MAKATPAKKKKATVLPIVSVAAKLTPDAFGAAGAADALGAPTEPSPLDLIEHVPPPLPAH